MSEGCFLVCFFFSFSFLGRIVSELGLVRRLLFEPCCPRPAVKATCGIEATVSVSTIMLCSDASPALPLVVPLLAMLTWRGASIGALVLVMRRPGLALPLSLPLSFIMRLAFDTNVFVARFSMPSACDDFSDNMLSASLLSISS